MKIVKTEAGWFYKKNSQLTPFWEYLRDVVNRSLPEPLYCISTSNEEIGRFIVFSLVDEPENKTGQLIDQFSLKITGASNLAAPLIVIYSVQNHPLVEKVVTILEEYHPKNLIIVSKKQEIMPFMLEQIINDLK